MPKIAIYKYLVFYIVSYDLGERLHLHISNTKSRKGRDAKIWLDTFKVFEKGDLTKKEIALCQELIKNNNEMIVSAIRKFAKGEKSKPIILV
jgi:hypothetical protein